MSVVLIAYANYATKLLLYLTRWHKLFVQADKYMKLTALLCRSSM